MNHQIFTLFFLVLIYGSAQADDESSFLLPDAGYVTPGQIMRYLFKRAAAPHDFMQAWERLVYWYEQVYATVATHAQIDAFAFHCRELRKQFFEHLFFDVSANEFIFIDDPSRFLHDSSLVPLGTYWHSTGNQLYARWYAMYFDCVAHLFLTMICTHSFDRALFEQRHHAVYRAYEELCQLVLLLKDSCYEKRYARQLYRYQELLELVRNSQ